MKRSAIGLYNATPVASALLLLLMVVFLTQATEAQTPSPQTATNQQRREAKPELVLQTGNNSSLGAARLVFSPDGRLLATTTLHSGLVKLWETATGRELRNVTSTNQVAPGTAPFVAFSNDNRLIATATADGSIKIWDLISGKELQTLPPAAEHSSGVHFIAFGANDRTLVLVRDSISLWDLASRRETRLGSSPILLNDREGSFALSVDGRQLAAIVSVNSSLLVKTFDLGSGRELLSMNLPNNSQANTELSFTSEGKLLVASVVDRRIRLWE